MAALLADLERDGEDTPGFVTLVPGPVFLQRWCLPFT